MLHQRVTRVLYDIPFQGLTRHCTSIFYFLNFRDMFDLKRFFLFERTGYEKVKKYSKLSKDAAVPELEQSS